VIFREADINDIKQMQGVRNAVKENTLSDPSLVKMLIVKNTCSTEAKAGFV
jgi:hypothetical protein